jgi:hypothetical protein
MTLPVPVLELLTDDSVQGVEIAQPGLENGDWIE